MRLFGHPVHVMLIHFPVALWPAHWALHLFAGWLPPATAAVTGFWLLVAGTVLGWLAAACGALDALELSREPAAARLNAALVHGAVNGTVLLAFTVGAAFEYADYPTVHHGSAYLAGEGVLLAALFAGNYFGAVARGDVDAPLKRSTSVLPATRRSAITR